MRLCRLIVVGISALAGAAVAQAAAKSPHAPTTLMSVADQKVFFDRFCSECHGTDDIRGNMTLTDLDVDHPETNAELTEKILRKVSVKMMPPPGRDSPDDATRKRFTAGLAGMIDSYAARHPDLGNPPLHRMNRTEYANSVRDLLGVTINAEKLLPSDDFSHGFDNMADVLGLSPALMEAYIRAAGKVSRLALGEAAAAPLMATYQIPRVVSQMKHVEGTPLGTRGGISVVHDFPADGEYAFRTSFYFALGGSIFGATQGKTQQLEISINGQRAALMQIDPNMAETDELTTPPVHIKAGPQRISAAFLVNSDGPIEDAVQPIGFSLLDLNQAALAGLTTLPHVHAFSVMGPSKVTGVSDTPSRRKLFTCYPRSAAEQEKCARSIITSLATQAFRRPVTQDEGRRLMQFYTTGHEGGGFEAGIDVALQAILSSPSFVFRFERVPEQYLHAATGHAHGPAAGNAISHPVTDIELASRLSYFLWSSAPDATLLRLASQNRLHKDSVLRAQVHRMLEDPRSIALSENFASQWLHLQNLKSLQPDGYLYPMYEKSLGDAMRRETVLFFDSVVRGNAPVTTLLDGRYTFVNEKLAALYGIPNVLGNRFRRVELTDEHRFGLLGKASILALTSASNRTSPVIRGKYVMEVFLGTAPPPPPPDVPTLKEHASEEGPQTVRARLEEHRRNPACAGCHKFMDPIGFALENYDPIGAWRGFDSMAPIDATGQLFDGMALDGPASLRRALMAHSEDFIGALSESLFAYGMGRVLRPADMPVVRKVQREAAAAGNTFYAFVLGIVDSAPFRMRSATAPAAPEKLVAQVPQTN
jgi:hypothetical protein